MAINSWQKLARDGIELVRQGRAHQALPLLQKAHKLAPATRDVTYWLANAYRMTGQPSLALSLFRKLLAERPDDYDASFAMAFLLRDMGKPTELATVLLRASRFPGITDQQLLQIAGFLRDVNQAPAAIEVCEAAVARNPGKADLRFKLARLYQTSGNFDQARDELRRTLDLDPTTGPAWTLLAQQKSFSNIDDADYKRIQAAAVQSLGQEADMCVSFALGKALDDLGHRSRAWEQYQQGNRLAAKTFPWSQPSWNQFIDKATNDAGAQLPADTGAGSKAVFIVGMPRSGTTLLEQLLDRHLQATGRGETNLLAHFASQSSALGSADSARLEALSQAYWTQLRLEGPETNRYIDKNPLNFRYLTELFRLLPNARILHVRRDGRDSCLSCYFQLFQHIDTSFTYQLDDLCNFYAGYRRLMTAWEQAHPDRIHTLNYGDLVKAPNEVLSQALRFLGLEWNESLMRPEAQETLVRSASVWQARQDVHTQSVARWRNYYDEAPEFFDRLAKIDSEYD